MAWPDRKTSRLRFGRISVPNAVYFITCCTKERAPVLLESNAAKITTDTLKAMHAAGDMDLLAATVMHDHVHMLFVLGARLQVGQIMANLSQKPESSGKLPGAGKMTALNTGSETPSRSKTTGSILS